MACLCLIIHRTEGLVLPFKRLNLNFHLKTKKKTSDIFQTLATPLEGARDPPAGRDPPFEEPCSRASLPNIKLCTS